MLLGTVKASDSPIGVEARCAAMLSKTPPKLSATGTSLTAFDRGSGCQGMSIYRANLLP